MAENKKRFPAAVGSSYTLGSERFDCQETINFYLEADELGTGKGVEPMVMMPTPGLILAQSIGTGPIRCLYTQSNDNITYVVSGDQVFTLTGLYGSPVALSGNLLTESGPVQAVDNGFVVMFVDGQFGYRTTISSGVLTQITEPNFYPTDTITWQDTYFIGVQKGTQAFFISTGDNDGLFSPNNLAFAQGNPDILVASISNNRQLYNIGTKSTETFWDSGQGTGVPFIRQDGRQSQVGIAAAQSLVILQETLFWLGSNAQGGGIVYTLSNGMPSRISTFAVERTLQGIGNISTATAWSYQQNGHYFYLLNVPGLNYTWCFDMSTGQWHKRQSDRGNGVKTQFIAQTHCILNGTHIVGDYQNGNIYSMDLNTWTENGLPIYRIRQFPHSSDNLNRVAYNLLEVDYQFGVGLPNTPTLPTAVLYDTFTGSGNLVDHTPNIGGTYVMLFGSDPSSMIISSNILRRPTYGENPGESTGRSSFYNTVLPPSTEFNIDFTMNFQNSNFGELLIATNGTNFGNPDIFLTLDFNSDNNMTVYLGGNAPAAFTQFVSGVDYAARLTVDPVTGDVTFIIDGTVLSTTNVGVGYFTGPLGFAIYDNNGNAVITLDDLKVQATGPLTQSAGVKPKAALYCSKDGGQTFGNPRYATLGKIGQYSWRARWGPLGSSRDMVFKIIISEPVRVVMLSGYIDVDEYTN